MARIGGIAQLGTRDSALFRKIWTIYTEDGECKCIQENSPYWFINKIAIAHSDSSN